MYGQTKNKEVDNYMKPIVKMYDKMNETVTSNLLEFPDFNIKCKLGKVLKDRGLKMQELGDLTGIRVATISELANMKRTSVNIPILLVIAKALRITDVSELFEFVMPEDLHEKFVQDKKEIDRQGILPDQQEFLTNLRIQRKNPPTN